MSYFCNIFLLQYCPLKCLVWIRPKGKQLCVAPAIWADHLSNFFVLYFAKMWLPILKTKIFLDKYHMSCSKQVVEKNKIKFCAIKSLIWLPLTFVNLCIFILALSTVRFRPFLLNSANLWRQTTKQNRRRRIRIITIFIFININRIRENRVRVRHSLFHSTDI